MNKTELAKEVANDLDTSLHRATEIIDTIFETITNTMKMGSAVRLVGFGSFSVTQRRASMGRNPRTGESISIPAARVPKFKPGKALKDATNYGDAGDVHVGDHVVAGGDLIFDYVAEAEEAGEAEEFSIGGKGAGGGSDC